MTMIGRSKAMEVNRWNWNAEYGSLFLDPGGDYVLYKDYADLEAKNKVLEALLEEIWDERHDMPDGLWLTIAGVLGKT